MRLKTVKTKNTIQYSIIQDITTINGKRTTRIYENLGTIDKIKLRCGNEEPLTWVTNYILELNKKAKEERLPIIITKYENRLIDKDIQNSFNGGYLFLQEIYYKLELDSICDEITNRYQFKYDLNSILSNLIYARIIYPSSKLKTLELCKNFFEQPNFDLHQIYRALMDTILHIQEQI